MLPGLDRNLANCCHCKRASFAVGWVEHGNPVSGALREPVQNIGKRFQGFDSVRNPPFPGRFAPRTLRSAATASSWQVYDQGLLPSIDDHGHSWSFAAGGGNSPALEHGFAGFTPTTARRRPPAAERGGRSPLEREEEQRRRVPLPVLKHGPNIACGENGRKRPSLSKRVDSHQVHRFGEMSCPTTTNCPLGSGSEKAPVTATRHYALCLGKVHSAGLTPLLDGLTPLLDGPRCLTDPVA